MTKDKVFEEGRDAGKMLHEFSPTSPMGYFWYGANLAELAKLSPVTVGYTSVDDIRDAMNTVIKIAARLIKVQVPTTSWRRSN